MKRLAFIFILLLLFSTTAFAQGKPCFYFVYGEGCPHCERINQYIISLEAAQDMDARRVSILQEAELTNSLYGSYGVPENMRGLVPIVFAGDRYLLGENEILENLEPLLAECGETGCKCGEQTTPAEAVSLPYISGLAAVDAVNPCELAVLIILMTSILTKFPKNKGKALRAGLSFTLAIFLVYMTFGILIITGFRFLAGAANLGGVLFLKMLGLLAVVLGLMNIKDAIWYGGGGFVMEVPTGWRPKMKSIINGANSVKGAFVIGVIVSFFLTPCTAGPYFVASGILSRVSLAAALPYLLLYMLIFISPMVVITLIVYVGFMTVEDAGKWRERNIRGLHWVAGLILLGLGIAMLLEII